jgi:cell division protein ZapE
MVEKFIRPHDFDNRELLTTVRGLLQKRYFKEIEQGHIQYDPAQEVLLNLLQEHLENVVLFARAERKKGWRNLFVQESKNCNSLYIYGGVGCGKSMLMDLFFEACPIQQKRRVHFHAFMQEVHRYNYQWRKKNQGSPIPELAKKIRNSTLLLCFDEFQVADIADAMILKRLFTELFDLGVVMTATSNRRPDELYKGGLQRDLFLPFIRLLKEQAKIVELKSKEDYRLVHLNALESTYHFPLNNDAELFLQFGYNELTNHAQMKPETFTVLGRKVTLSAVHGDIALVTFDEICLNPLGAADYLEIARRFNTLMISRIPRFFPENRNEAKRFVTLIDILYEHKVKLICTAAAPPMELYTEGDGVFEFQRTASRLMEMQSDKYLHSEHVSD